MKQGVKRDLYKNKEACKRDRRCGVLLHSHLQSSDGEPKRRQNMPKETYTTSKRPTHEIYSAVGCCAATFSRKMKNLKHGKRDLYQFKKRHERDPQKRPSPHCVGALPLQAIKRRVTKTSK